MLFAFNVEISCGDGDGQRGAYQENTLEGEREAVETINVETIDGTPLRQLLNDHVNGIEGIPAREKYDHLFWICSDNFLPTPCKAYVKISSGIIICTSARLNNPCYYWACIKTLSKKNSQSTRTQNSTQLRNPTQ